MARLVVVFTPTANDPGYPLYQHGMVGFGDRLSEINPHQVFSEQFCGSKNTLSW